MNIIIPSLQDAFPPGVTIPIIGMTYYNPLLAVDPNTEPLLAWFNGALKSVYLNPVFDNVYLADVALAFNSDIGDVLVPFSESFLQLCLF